ncbi:MAG: GPW/gp25 family protein [Bacteroidota bacterium]
MANQVNTEEAFLGTGWAFPPCFDAGSETVSAQDDIDQSLRLIIFTHLGERMMNQEFGCKLGTYRFAPMNQTNITLMQDAIRSAIVQWEPRITLNSVEVDTTEAVDGKLMLSLDYTVRITNSRSNLVYPYYLNEANL